MLQILEDFKKGITHVTLREKKKTTELTEFLKYECNLRQTNYQAIIYPRPHQMEKSLPEQHRSYNRSHLKEFFWNGIK